MRAVLQRFHIFAHTRTADAGVAFDTKEIAKSDHNLLDLLS
jgi:hypothetical protein